MNKQRLREVGFRITKSRDNPLLPLENGIGLFEHFGGLAGNEICYLGINRHCAWPHYKFFVWAGDLICRVGGERNLWSGHLRPSWLQMSRQHMAQSLDLKSHAPQGLYSLHEYPCVEEMQH